MLKSKLKINYCSMLFKILMFLILVGCFGYIRLLDTYHGTVNYMMVVLVYSVCLLYVFRKRVEKLPWIWTIVWIYIAISIPFLNFPNSVRYLIIFSLGMILLKLSTASDIFEKIPKLMSIVGIFFAAMTIFQEFLPMQFNNFLRIVQTEKIYEQTIRYKEIYDACCGIAGESSFNAFCISIGILCLVASIFSNNRKIIMKVVVIGIMYYSITLTEKRSFILIIPMILIFLFLMQAIASEKKKDIIICLALLIILPILFYSFLGDVVMNLLENGKGGSADAVIDLSNREVFWEIAFNMIRESPIYGYGMMAYDNFYNNYFSNTHTFAGAHNSYFQLLAEIGCIGGALYIAAILMTFFSAVKVTCDSIKKGEEKMKKLMYSSLSIQALCIIYGWSGNPFHRPQQLLTYFVAIGIGIYAQKCLRKGIK